MENQDSTKALRTILRSHGRHWVGDGFPVRSLFNYSEHGRLLDPFLLFDYAGPAEHVTEETGYRVPMGSRGQLVSGFGQVLEQLVEDPSGLRAGLCRNTRRSRLGVKQVHLAAISKSLE